MQDIVPIKIYEYMAMQKPVIATRLPGLVAEFGEKNGIIYINTPEEVLDVVHEKFKNKKEIEKISLAGYNFVKDNDWSKLKIINWDNVPIINILTTLDFKKWRKRNKQSSIFY